MVKFYGMVEYIGECEETKNIRPDFDVLKNFNFEKYKEIKPLSSSENGVRVFRAFADANTLARISITNPDYQRKIDKKHKEEIENYIKNSQPNEFYFPELTLLYEYDAERNPEDIVKPITKDFTNKNDTEIMSIMAAIGIYSLEIKDDEKLYRLDGNHRLEALKNSKKGNKMLSFCIILTPKTKEYSLEHMYFYLLNSKALPIHSLKTLDIITQANKEMKEFIDNDDFLSIMSQSKDCWHNLNDDEKENLVIFVNEIMSKDRNKDELINIIKEAMWIYQGQEAKEAKEAKMAGFICFLRHKCKDTQETRQRLDDFKEWVKRFKYDVSHFYKFNDLYEAFDKYDKEIKRKRFIFVAMQYDEEYKNTYTSAIKDVIQRFKGKNSKINFELTPIMECKSDENIPNKIFKEIDKCDIFIADISTNNLNVAFEYGYAKAKDKHIILLKSKEWRDEVKKEISNIKSKYIQKIKSDLEKGFFDIRVNHCIEWSENDLKDKLEKAFNAYLDDCEKKF